MFDIRRGGGVRTHAQCNRSERYTYVLMYSAALKAGVYLAKHSFLEISEKKNFGFLGYVISDGHLEM